MNRKFIFNSLLLTVSSASAMHDPNAAAPKPTLLKELKMSSPSDAAYTPNEGISLPFQRIMNWLFMIPKVIINQLR